MEMSLLNIMMRDERSLIQKSSKGVKCKLFRKETNEMGCDKVSDEQTWGIAATEVQMIIVGNTKGPYP